MGEIPPAEPGDIYFVYFFRLWATALSLPSRVVVSRARKILLLKLLTWWGIAAKKQPFRLFFLAHRANTGSIPYLWESNKVVLNDDLNGRQIRRQPTSVERGDRFPSGLPNVTNPNYFVNRNWFGFVFYYNDSR